MLYQVLFKEKKFIDSNGKSHKFFNGLLGAEIKYKSNCYCISEHPELESKFLLVDLLNDRKYWYKTEDELWSGLNDLLTGKE